MHNIFGENSTYHLYLLYFTVYVKLDLHCVRHECIILLDGIIQCISFLLRIALYARCIRCCAFFCIKIHESFKPRLQQCQASMHFRCSGNALHTTSLLSQPLHKGMVSVVCEHTTRTVLLGHSLGEHNVFPSLYALKQHDVFLTPVSVLKSASYKARTCSIERKIRDFYQMIKWKETRAKYI